MYVYKQGPVVSSYGLFHLTTLELSGMLLFFADMKCAGLTMLLTMLSIKACIACGMYCCVLVCKTLIRPTMG